MLAALNGSLPDTDRATPVRAGRRLRYAYPQRLTGGAGNATLLARAKAPARGVLRLKDERGTTIAQRPIDALPERRLRLDVPCALVADAAELSLSIED